jgi:tetratricopeptide (TPR) repeat protein
MDDSPQPSQDNRQFASRRSIVIGTLIVIGATAGLAVWQKHQPQRKHSADRRDRNAASTRREVPNPPAPPRSVSPYLNTQHDVQYVGSEACRNCHRQAHRSFSQTHHARSLSLVSETEQPPEGVVDHPLSRRSYRIEQIDGVVWHRDFALGGNGDRTELDAHPVKYQVGSGHVARTYLVEQDGFLLESPVTWFTRAGRWEISPGYDAANQQSFGRIIRGGCLYCHSGHVEPADDSGHRYRIEETAIGCERCHGPGELHVRKRKEGLEVADPEGMDPTIVNPRRLPRELSESVCAQCHLQGSVKVTVRGRQPDDFRPGLPLQEYRLEFRTASPAADMTVAGHVEQLHQSRCYQQSQTLTCITCHHPHDDSSPADRLAQHRETCNGCHQQQRCRMPENERQSSNGDNCLQCHMPRAATEVTHVALTHHRIGIHKPSPPREKTTQEADDAPLLPLQPLDHLSDLDRNRSLGLALLTSVRMAGKSPEQMPRLERAAQLLRQAFDGGIRDPETLTALAGIARDMNRLPLGISLAEEALLADDIPTEVRLEACDILAELHFRAGRLETAAGYLKVINRGTRSPLHWYLLGQIEQELGDSAACIAALRQAVELAPGNAEYRKTLIPLLQKAGLTEEAERHRRLIEALDDRRPPPSK